MELRSAAKSTPRGAHDHQRDYVTQTNRSYVKEKELSNRPSILDESQIEDAKVRGNGDLKDDELVEINAGGKVITTKRSTLTQLKGTRLETLFSGKYDRKLQRDHNGRIFLHVDHICFQVIVDYLNEPKISPEGHPPEPPSVDDEHKHILSASLNCLGY